MSQFYRLALPIIALALSPACDSARAQSFDQSARVSFEDKKEVRLLGIHAERSMIGSQPVMIATFIEQLPLAPVARDVVAAKIATIESRLVDADRTIAALEAATAENWTLRDAAATDAMRRLEAARDDAWSALKNAPRIPSSS